MQCPECQATLPAEARFCLSCGARLESAPSAAPADRLFETLTQSIGFQYRMERLLGRGGMGAVYLAHELALDRDVAIKVLPPELAGTPELRERFRREARTAARLSHPHIVPLHTFGEVSGLIYFVMGYVGGESLGARLARQGPIDAEEARTLLAGICDALDYAHRQGVVHRDLKPDNILIDGAGTPMLTDFGIAKASFAEAQLTTAGQLIGTPHYMSPEQASGRADIGPRSDLYSLGVLAYEMLSGRLPFDAGNPMEALSLRLTSPPKPLGTVASEVPADVARAIDRCLERDPARRWPDAKSLREALLPTDDDPEETVAGRMLRASTVIWSLIALAAVHLAVYRALHPDTTVRARGWLLLAGGSIPMLILAAIASFTLRGEGLSGRAILAKAFQQPRWWRSWWPTPFRRRGDQWTRLPREVKRFRMWLGVMQVYVLVVFLPLQLTMVGSEQWPLLQPAALVLQVTLIALTFAERRRATRFVSVRTGTTPLEASTILSTPTWRLTAWRRAPANLLLMQRAGTPPLLDAAATVATRLDAGSSDQATRL